MLELNFAILAVFLVGALAGGFVTGLTGFGTALVVSGFWLHFLDPVTVAPLAAICSVAGQVSSLKGTWRYLQWRAVTPFLIGAGIGLPVGSLLLDYVEADHIKLGVGLFLICYCSYFLLVKSPPRIQVDNRIADTGVGVIGGLMGGMAALSGPAPLIWCQLRGLAKTVQRGIYQPYNMIVLGVSVGLHGLNGRITQDIGLAFLIAMTFIGWRLIPEGSQSPGGDTHDLEAYLSELAVTTSSAVYGKTLSEVETMHWRTEPENVEKFRDDLWLGVKG